MNSVLHSFREFHNWKEEDVADKISTTLQAYKNLELGIEKMDEETALKLSELYLAPPQFFLSNSYSNDVSIIYSHCHFENSNGYVNHLYHDNEDLLKAKEQTIQLLKEAVVQLQKENEKLLERLFMKP
jgi:transcriptional regulator with XRE-family HTH domain